MSKLIRNLSLAILLSGASPWAMAEASYGEMVRTKLASGLTNMSFGLFEIPKNVINTSNEVNVLLGATGGVLKGTLHTVGRLLAGSVDFLTFLVPSQPITHPAYVWEDFKTDTTYGPFFDMNRTPRVAKPAPVATKAPQTP